MPSRFRLWFQDKTNPLHIFARLVDMAKWYDKIWRRFFFGRKKDDELTKEQIVRLAVLANRKRRLMKEIRRHREEQENENCRNNSA